MDGYYGWDEKQIERLVSAVEQLCDTQDRIWRTLEHMTWERN